MKTCFCCKQAKLEAEFYRNKARSDGLSTYCKVCTTSKMLDRGYWRTDGQRVHDNHRKRNKKYQLDEGWYEAKLEEQGGVCAICQETCKTGKNLAVDHDHDTGINRGLLCMDCNTALGKLRDSTALLERAIDYLATARK